MLRISLTASTHDTATLHLEGQIVSPSTEELAAACTQVLNAGRQLTLDLRDVSLIDRPALAFLAELAARAVTFARCSPFHAEQIRQAAPLLPQPLGELV